MVIEDIISCLDQSIGDKMVTLDIFDFYEGTLIMQ